MEPFQHILEHWDDAAVGMAAWYIGAAFVGALPEPLPMGSRLYLFFFRFAHLLAANFDRAKGKQP